MDKITIKGAKTHNLKNIDVTIPRDKLVVLTGLSGSGKSSLAFERFMPKGRGDMSNRCLLMPVNSWGKWINRMWT